MVIKHKGPSIVEKSRCAGRPRKADGLLKPTPKDRYDTLPREHYKVIRWRCRGSRPAAGRKVVPCRNVTANHSRLCTECLNMGIT